MDSDTHTSKELETLRELLVCLNDERDAIAKLDPAGIDRAAHRKAALDQALVELHATRIQMSWGLAQEAKAQYLELLDAIRPLAEQNARGLQTAHRTVRGLINAMTGADKRAYGRQNAPIPTTSAILTSSIG